MKRFPGTYSVSAIMVFTLLLIMQHSNAQSYKLTPTSDMVRVFDDGIKLPAMYDSVKMAGMKGEIVSGQFVLNARKDLSNVTVENIVLRSKNGNSLSPSWNFVGSVPLTKNTPNQPERALTRKAPALFPEYLMEERQLNIKGKTWKGIWLTLEIPENAAPGNYSGTAVVKAGIESQSVPVSVTVFPLTMPDERHLKVVEWMNLGAMSKYHGINERYSPQWFDMLGKYAANMAAHRQNIFPVPMNSIIITKSKDGSFSFDFKDFDRISDVFWNTGKMDFLTTGGIGKFGPGSWASTEISLEDVEVKDAESGKLVKLPGEEVMPAFLQALESHLRAKGWLKKTLFSIHDEPSIHNALAWMSLSDYVHKYAPELIRMDAIETTFLLPSIDVAVPKLDHFSTFYDTYRKWQEKGHELWFYTVGIYQGSLFPDKTIDVPLMDTRLIHWVNYRYGATGYLHWGWNQWEGDPFTDVGMHIGDAWHVYPVKNGVLNSIRWEEMRNGIQDYEYFWLLENKIESLKNSLGSRFYWINPKQRSREIAGQVIYNFAERTSDPQVVNDTKAKVVREILDMDRTPGTYVQCTPPEGSEITSGSTVEVFGWTEAGTKININGQDTPVNRNGSFYEQYQLEGPNAAIVVLASKDGKVRKIVRSYILK